MRIARSLLAGLALAMAASSCSLIGGGDTYEVIAYFPRAVSLYEEGSVQVLGLPAGTIDEIEIVGDQVKVTMVIESDVPIPTGVQAAIAPQSLIGERRIQLSPPFKEGDEVIEDGYVITQDDTIVPVEADEALAALKEFLDTLDANGIGRLIENGAEALDGQGQNLGQAIDELATLVDNVEDNDTDIISIAERFDDFTSTLLTRETQLASAIEDFASVAEILAEERSNIEALVTALTDLSGSGLDLVSEHAVRLRSDVQILTRLAASIQANLGAVEDIVEGGLALSEGLDDAYNEELRAINLRTNLDAVVSTTLQPVLDLLGLDALCTELISQDCPAGASQLPEPPVGGLSADEPPVPAEIPAPSTPIDDILSALGTPGERVATDRATSDATRHESLVDRLVGTFLGVGS